MTHLKKCQNCNIYTLEEKCKSCKKPTNQAGYKFRTYNKIKTDEED